MGDRATDDDSFLDEAYDRVVARVEDGLEVDLSSLVAGREHLRGEVEELVLLAHDLVAAGRARLPSLSGYELLGELGRGGMGTVYLARQLEVGGRLVALKTMPAFAGFSREARARFLAEIRALASLRHPSVVTIHDVVSEGPLVAYAMEWIDGPNLSELVARVAESEGRESWALVRRLLPGVGASGSYPAFVARVGEQLASALEVVHAAGLLHRDVKPSNVLLRRDGTALLADFGLVRDEDGSLHTRTGAFVGTPAYAPPEQLRGETERLGPASDLYSLGATLHHALARRPPFLGRDALSVLRAVEAERLPRLRAVDREIPRDLETVVATALDPDPKRRYTRAAALEEDLRRLRELRPILARPPGLGRRLAKTVRRHRPSVVGGVSGAAAVGLLIVLLAGWFVWLPRRIDEGLRRARVALLDRTFSELIVLSGEEARYGAHGSYERVREARTVKPGISEEALAAYRSVVRLAAGRELPRLRAEAATVELAAALRDAAAEAPIQLELPASYAPELVLELATHGRRGLALPLPDEIDWSTRSDVELSCAGLFGYLCEHVPTLEAAWNRLDTMDRPDPLVDAALGQVLLRQDRFGAAAHRLRAALEEFPEAAFLAIDLARALFALGDVDAAERLVDRAESLRQRDPFESGTLLRARIAAARGRDEEAHAHFHDVADNHRYGRLRIAFGDFLLSRGRWMELVENALYFAEDHPHLPLAHRRLVASVGVWVALGGGSRWIAAGESPVPCPSGRILELPRLARQLERSAGRLGSPSPHGRVSSPPPKPEPRRSE